MCEWGGRGYHHSILKVYFDTNMGTGGDFESSALAPNKVTPTSAPIKPYHHKKTEKTKKQPQMESLAGVKKKKQKQPEILPASKRVRFHKRFKSLAFFVI